MVVETGVELGKVMVDFGVDFFKGCGELVVPDVGTYLLFVPGVH
jgi:hypothetical protein